MCTLILTHCSNCGGSLCAGTFSRGFSASFMSPSNRQKLRITPSRRLQQELLCAPTFVYCGKHVSTMKAPVRALFQALLGALSAKGGQTAGYSMSANTAGCPSKSVACLERLPRQTWVLNSVAKFVYCVQTLKGYFDEAGIAAKFGHQKRCRG